MTALPVSSHTGLCARRTSAFAFKAASHGTNRALRLRVLSVGPGPQQPRQGGQQGGGYRSGGGGGYRPGGGNGGGGGGGGPYRTAQGIGVRTVPRPRPDGSAPPRPRPDFGAPPRPRPDGGMGVGGRSFDSDEEGGRRGGYDRGPRGDRRGGDRRAAQQTLVPINTDIRATEVRVIAEDKSAMGVMSMTAALDLARDTGVDLVLVVPDANPPVCRLISYSKYKYELEKADKDKKKQQRESRIDTKELKLRPNTDTHDYETKVRQAQKFLSKGDRVKVTLQFKGREMDHNEIGKEMFSRLLTDLESDATVEQGPSMQGRSMNMVLAPKKAAV